MAVVLDAGGGGYAIDVHGDLVAPGAQQPAVEVEVLGPPRGAGYGIRARHGKEKRQGAAVVAAQFQGEIAGSQVLRRRARNGDVDPFIGLVSGARQR